MKSPTILRRLAQITLLPLCLMSICAAGQNGPAELRYRLSAGDRLVYREVFDREGKSADTTFHARVVFSSQVMVVDAASGRALVGFQRNRQSAELLEYRERGSDTLAQQKPAFEQSLDRRPQYFADTNLFSAAGQALLPAQVVREAYSKLLHRIVEFMPLPVTPVQVGSEWDPGISGLHMKLERFEPVASESCALFGDTGTRKDSHLRLTFCPASGRLVNLVFEGQYQEFDTTIHEKVTLELREVHPAESAASWLADTQTQLGALRTFGIAVSPLPDASVMNAVLRTASPQAQALALAADYQRAITPAPDVLQPLLQSPDAEVRRIAARFQQPAPKPESQPCDLPAERHPREKPGTTLRSIADPAFANVPYIVHVPLDYRGDQPFPLIVYLSGGGGQAFDGALTAGEALAHAGYLVLYPHAGGDLWWEPRPTQMVHALLLEVLRTYNVDTNRVYLAGFSNGGTAALEFATRWPDRFAAIASLMGAGLDTPSGTKLPLQNLLDVPVLFLHGDQDPRIPSSASSSTYNALRGLNPRVPPELHVLKGRGHDLTFATDDGYLLPFFGRFAREPFPRSLSATIWDDRYPRQYWMEIVESGKAAAQLEGKILDNNVIELKAKNVKRLRLLLRPELLANSGPVHVRLNGRELPAFELKRDCRLFQRSAQSSADPFLAYTDEIVIAVPQ